VPFPVCVAGPQSAAEGADDGGYVVFLEEADGGYAGGAGLQAGLGVLQSNSSQREDGDVGAAGLAESFQACGRCAFFFEDGSEDGQGGLVGRGFGYFLRGVTGYGYQRILW